jgi:hypothetical protein
MTTWDGELLEKIFSIFAKKNKNSNFGWETLGDALTPERLNLQATCAPCHF